MIKEDWINETARVSFTPIRSGDGYSFGGATIVAIGPFALELGEHPQAQRLGKEIADRWNANANAATARDVTLHLAALEAEVERLRGALLHIECMKYADADELREIARQALGDTHD